jgi:hypothetical protein
VKARLAIVQPLLLEGVFGFRAPLTMPEGTLSGTMALEWQGSPTESTLRAVSSTADDLQMIQGGLPWRWTRMRVERKVRHDEPGVASTLAFDFERGAATARVVTDVAVGGALNSEPVAGTVRVLAGGGRELRVKLQPRTSSFANMSFEIVGSEGRVLQTTSAVWDTDNGALVWDGRDLLQYTHPIRQVPAEETLEGPRNVRFQQIAQMFEQPGSTQPVDIDPLFLHPVLPAPGVTSAEAVFRLQLPADIQEGQAEPKFRFVNIGPPIPPALPRPPIEARLTRRGALWLLQPAESLGHGTGYVIETSLDGVDWDPDSVRLLRLRNGTTVRLSSRLGLGSIFTPATLLLTVPTNQVILLGTGDSLSFTASVQAARGQGIASFRWQQVSGEPLLLETPETATTRVRPAATASGLVGPAQLMLTVVDSLGNVERLRLNLTVGDRVASGALLYAAWQLDASVQSFFPPRDIATGLGRVDVAAGRPGTLMLTAGFSNPFPSGDLHLAPPAGANLAVGSYEGASLDPAATGVPYLSCLTGTCDAQTRSRFQVLQLERDAQGRITRLAVDYEQTSPRSIRPKVTGGYRFNSTLPVGP